VKGKVSNSHFNSLNNFMEQLPVLEHGPAPGN